MLIDLGYGHCTRSAVRCGALLASWREHGCFCLAGCPIPQPCSPSVGQAALVSGSVVLPGPAPWVPSWSSVTGAHGLPLRICLLMPAPRWAQVRYHFSKPLSSPLSFTVSPALSRGLPSLSLHSRAKVWVSCCVSVCGTHWPEDGEGKSSDGDWPCGCGTGHLGPLVSWSCVTAIMVLFRSGTARGLGLGEREEKKEQAQRTPPPTLSWCSEELGFQIAFPNPPSIIYFSDHQIAAACIVCIVGFSRGDRGWVICAYSTFSRIKTPHVFKKHKPIHVSHLLKTLKTASHHA